MTYIFVGHAHTELGAPVMGRAVFINDMQIILFSVNEHVHKINVVQKFVIVFTY